MKRSILAMSCFLFAMGLPAAAQITLNSHESIEIKASIWEVWDAVKDFDGLSNWHPMFSGSETTMRSGSAWKT